MAYEVFDRQAAWRTAHHFNKVRPRTPPPADPRNPFAMFAVRIAGGYEPTRWYGVGIVRPESQPHTADTSPIAPD